MFFSKKIEKNKTKNQKKIKIEKKSKLPTDFSVSNRLNERERGASRSFSRKKLTTRERGASRSFSRKKLTTLERGERHAHSVEKN